MTNTVQFPTPEPHLRVEARLILRHINMFFVILEFIEETLIYYKHAMFLILSWHQGPGEKPDNVEGIIIMNCWREETSLISASAKWLIIIMWDVRSTYAVQSNVWGHKIMNQSQGSLRFHTVNSALDQPLRPPYKMICNANSREILEVSFAS
jgi:hypothetical protein